MASVCSIQGCVYREKGLQESFSLPRNKYIIIYLIHVTYFFPLSQLPAGCNCAGERAASLHCSCCLGLSGVIAGCCLLHHGFMAWYCQERLRLWGGTWHWQAALGSRRHLRAPCHVGWKVLEQEVGCGKDSSASVLIAAAPCLWFGEVCKAAATQRG